MKQTEIKIVWPGKVNSVFTTYVQIFLLSLCFVNGCLNAIVYMDMSLATFIWQGELMAVLGILFSLLAEKIKSGSDWGKTVILIPWLGLAIFSNPLLWWQGFLNWLNALIYRWNELHEGGVPLFQVERSDDAMRGFFMAASLFFGIFLWQTIRKRRMISGLCLAVVFFVLMLLEERFYPLAGILLMVALLGMAISDIQFHFGVRNLIWMLIVAFILVGAAVPQTKVQSALAIKETVKTGVHDLRYGKAVLPEGDLNRSGMLHDSDKRMLTLWSEQKKNLYLKGFVGAKYQNGKWRKMPDSAYAGTYQGVMSWLADKNFSPVTQVSRYYQLSNKDDQPQLNKIQVNVDAAAKDYVYVPMGLTTVDMGDFKEEKDFALKNIGLGVESLYAYEESSKENPSELLVPLSWIENPKTEEQKEYCEAEAVYRNFVYDNYTEVDEELLPVIKDMFWSDYASDSDGIYSAVSQVRDVLKKNQNKESLKENTEYNDPLLGFLENGEQKNAVYYATAGVMALRVHGIPARYIEGYYVSENRFDGPQNQQIELSGQDAHAWVEVYFDGIGWLPVDVTPGYYYDAATLQTMVQRPDDIKKTAALDNGDTEADEANKPGNAKDMGKQNKPQERISWKMVVAGAGILLMLGVSCAILFMEIKRAVFLLRKKKELCNGSDEERVTAMESQIFGILEFWNISAGLGWNTEQMDERVSDSFLEIQPGEYMRICQLLEKHIYGGETLTVYEERTIRIFLGHLVESVKEKRLFDRIRFHYAQENF